MSVGPFCDLSMDVNSTGWQQGAVVSLKLDENEREFMRLVEEFMEQGFSQQQAIDEARETLEKKWFFYLST